MKKRYEQILTILGLGGILAISIFLNFYNLGVYPFNPDEGVYSAQAAIWSGHDEYSKNFLLFSRSATNFQIHQVIVGTFFKYLGISEYVARLPSAIFGVLTVLLVFILADALFNRRTAMFASFFMATNNYLIHFNRQNHLDTTLVFLLVLSMLLFVKWNKTDKDYYFYSFLLVSILTVMTKVIILLPIGVMIISYLYIEKKTDSFKRMLFKPLSIMIILLALIYAYYYIYSIVGIENYINTFTYATGRQSKQVATFYIDVIKLFMGYAIPIIAIIGMVDALKTRNKEEIFISLWTVMVIIFFTYYPLQGYSYILPAVPAIAMLNAKVFDRLMEIVNIPIFIIIVLLFSVVASTYSAVYYPYNTFSDVANIDPSIIERFDPIRYVAIKDTTSWLNSNADKNSGILVYTFADQHDMAYYSGLRTYTIKNYPGFYMPVNGKAQIIWEPIDSFNLLKTGEIDYVLFMEESNIERNLTTLNREYGIGYDLVYYKSYATPEWYRGGSLNVSMFKISRPKIADMGKLDKSSFTIVVIPDTQVYSRHLPYIFRSQVEWVEKNKDNLNIKFVIQTGDLVQSGLLTGEYSLMSNIFNTLDNDSIPYLVGIGNHDYNDMITRDSTSFNTYFGYRRYEKYNWFGGNYPPDGGENIYGLFNTSEEKFLVMTLNMCPSDNDIRWANDVISSYPDRKVIISTHSYLNSNGLRHSLVCTNLEVYGNDGEDIFTKLISGHDNIIIVLSGHKFGMARKIDVVNGQPVMQIVADYEMLENGGDGYLRLYTFKPLERRIDVYTYSPYRNKFDTSPENQFSFIYTK